MTFHGVVKPGDEPMGFEVSSVECIDKCMSLHYHLLVGRQLTPFLPSAAIQRKLAEKHDVHLEEIKEVFDSDPVILRGKTDQYGERRYTALGATGSGRLLLVVFTIAQAGRAKIITARVMTAREQKYYKKKGRK